MPGIIDCCDVVSNSVFGDNRFLGRPVKFSDVLHLISWYIICPLPSLLAYHFKAWFSISTHALNLPFALFEILFTNVQPAPWITLPGGLLILAAYLGVAYITEADQGFYSALFSLPFALLRIERV
jgi:hypothetical protein